MANIQILSGCVRRKLTLWVFSSTRLFLNFTSRVSLQAFLVFPFVFPGNSSLKTMEFHMRKTTLGSEVTFPTSDILQN